MSFAYLILAHKNPSQLLKLVQALDSKECVFIIHLDLKSAVKPFIRLFEDFTPGKVFFCPDRKNVFWGDYSMIEATMSLIQFFVKMRIMVQYVHLISGQDYPLRSNDKILSYFEKNNGKNFMDFFLLPDQRWKDGGLERFKQYIFEDKNTIIQEQCGYDTIKKVKAYLPPGVELYGGSQWWSLHIDCIRFIEKEYKNENILFDFFKKTSIPDEMLFQTLILNSPYKSFVINDNLRYIKWENQEWHPAILTQTCYDELVSTKKLFARKFEPEEDSQIFNQLDLFRKSSNKNNPSGDMDCNIEVMRSKLNEKE